MTTWRGRQGKPCRPRDDPASPPRLRTYSHGTSISGSIEPGRDPERLGDSRASALVPTLPLVSPASRRGWLAPSPSGCGGHPAARAARETLSAHVAAAAERSRRRSSPERRRPQLTRVPAREGRERHLEGDQSPWRTGRPTPATVSRHYGLVDGARPRSRPSQAIPRSGGNVDSGARASAPVGNVQVPLTAPAKVR